jgi:hypothetical protein
MIKRAGTISARPITDSSALAERPPRQEFRSAQGDFLSFRDDRRPEIKTIMNRDRDERRLTISLGVEIRSITRNSDL